MTSLKESSDATDGQDKELAELPPSGTSLHKRRRGEPPASLSVKPQTPSDEGSSPCTAGPIGLEYSWSLPDGDIIDPETLCESMIQRLKDRDDLASKRGKELAVKTKDTVEALEQLEKLVLLLDQFVTLKEHNARMLRKLRQVNHLTRLHEMCKKIETENALLKSESKEIQMINEAFDAELESEYGQAMFDCIMAGGRSMKRSGSKWKGHARFGGSLLRRQRARSAGGDDSDVTPGTPLRRRSEGIFSKEVEKSKVSKWTKVKAAFRWEKAQWPQTTGSAVAAGAMVGVVALAGSSPSSPGQALAHPERDSASLTPGSALSLTPNSSCEELRMEPGMCRKSILRCDENDNTFLHAPTQDDSSTSPSPNKLHKGAWGKMRDIIQTGRESVRKKTRGSKSSPDVVPMRRRSMSDGGDSDAPPALTLTIPSSEELESEPSHPVLRKQRSLELGARPPQHRPPRASKWTKVKRAFLTSASASVPSSPNRHSAFFTDVETEGLSSGCEASGFRDEIARDYAALQTRLGREFSDRRGKLHSGPARPVPTREQLSADFQKKLDEWQMLKGMQPPPFVPERKDLSEDFLKKLDAWNRMKETNSVPSWAEQSKPDQVLVRTSTGLFKFQGISRSFTRKLHEWEKSRGIAPEASTSALLRAARAPNKVPRAAPAQLTRTQSDGSVAPSMASGHLHASSLSVNDADDFESEYEREHLLVDDEDPPTRGAVLVEVEAEEVCTAAPLVAVSPRPAPQQPVYSYGLAEARLLCETSSAAVTQPSEEESSEVAIHSSSSKRVPTLSQNFVHATVVMDDAGSRNLLGSRTVKANGTGAKPKTSREQSKPSEKSTRRKIARQPSIEEDAKFIRKTIEEIERGSSSRFTEETEGEPETQYFEIATVREEPKVYKTPQKNVKQVEAAREKTKSKEDIEDPKEDKRKEEAKGNGKKKSKSRARLEREQSKPSESDTEQDVDTVTVEIPRRRKRPRRASERPRTPPTSLHSDSEGEVFVLKLKAPGPREGSPEVIVKTTRKIFSPVVRSGESVPRAVIPVNVEDLDDVRPSEQVSHRTSKHKDRKANQELYARSKSSGDLQESEEQRPTTRPPLPTSPSSQRKPQPKETAPSIRIMIQRYNMKINEEGHTSPASSGASSPAWRSPALERRRPPDMPVGVNIRNNPFLEREVQKSASACQLSRRDQTSVEKPLTPVETNLDGVLKSRSANALHPELPIPETPPLQKETEDSQETIKCTTASTDTIVPDLTMNLPDIKPNPIVETTPVLRQMSDIVLPSITKIVKDNPALFARSISNVEPVTMEVEAAQLSERTARIRAARERFLASPVPMRREGTSSASDLRPGDRSSRISCESDVTESSGAPEPALGRSASTGMVNVDQEAWQRVAEGGRGARSRSRFSLARLAARWRRKEGAVSRLCRQSLLVHLPNKH